jgi:zinc protease
MTACERFGRINSQQPQYEVSLRTLQSLNGAVGAGRLCTLVAANLFARTVLWTGLLLLVWTTLPCKGQNHSADISRVALANGVRLLLRPEPMTERVAVSLFIRTDAGPSGFSAAIGEMVARALFYGNTNRTQNGILTLAKEAGGSLDVLRTPDYVVINYVTTPRQLPEATHLMCDCLKSAEFAPESLRRALDASREERSRRQENGFWHGYDAICELLGRTTPSDAELARVTQPQAQAYFRRWYVPAHTVISLVGRFDSRQVAGMFGAFLTDYNRPDTRRLDAARETLSDLPVPPDAAVPHTLFAPTRAAYALVGTDAPGPSSPDYPAFVVLQTLLGGGHASRLFRQAREFGGVGYQVGTLYQAEQKGPLVAYLQWSPQRAISDSSDASGPLPTTPASIQKALQAQLEALIASPPTDAETVRARNFAIGQDALRHELARDRAFFPGWYETLGLGYEYDAEFPRLLAAITPADIQRVAKIYLHARAVVLVLPQAQ